MVLKLGLFTITCFVCLVASTPQYNDESYYDRRNPSYGQYDPGYSPQYSGSRVRSVKPEQKGTLPNRQSETSRPRPMPANGQGHPINGQAGTGVPGKERFPQEDSRAPNGQGFPNGGANDYGYDNGASFPNGPTYSNSGTKKPGFESHYSDTRHYSGSQGRVNYETNIQNSFHYIENTERNVYVIPPTSGSGRKQEPNNKVNINKQDKNKSVSFW